MARDVSPEVFDFKGSFHARGHKTAKGCNYTCKHSNENGMSLKTCHVYGKQVEIVGVEFGEYVLGHAIGLCVLEWIECEIVHLARHPP